MKKLFLSLIIFVTAIITGCSGSNSYQHLDADEAMKIIETEKNIVILDVRTAAEYEKKHIPGSVLLPIEELRNGNFKLLTDKNQKILIYCWTGRRAEDSAKILAENGYTNVFEFGGLVSWTGELEGTEVDS